ncbi:MAG: 50S ribosomal protein L9 [Chloroflexota bacterium]
MQVLLLEDVDNLGLAGDVAKVAPGFGRNYLIPQKMAILATPGALKRAEAVRKAGELRRAQEKSDAEAIVGQIEGQVLIFERRSGERGQLYGSVTVAEIADVINEKFDIDIDRRKIRLPEPIRSIGEYDVAIRLMVEVTTTVHVVVLNEGETYNPNAAAEAEAAEAEAEAAEAATEEVVEEAEEVTEASSDDAMADMVADAIDAVDDTVTDDDE